MEGGLGALGLADAARVVEALGAPAKAVEALGALEKVAEAQVEVEMECKESDCLLNCSCRAFQVKAAEG